VGRRFLLANRCGGGWSLCGRVGEHRWQGLNRLVGFCDVRGGLAAGVFRRPGGSVQLKLGGAFGESEGVGEASGEFIAVGDAEKGSLVFSGHFEEE